MIFTDDVEGIDVRRIGPMLEHSEIFPKRANISFATVVDPANIRMRVWERGIGETWACGTGACAVAAAAVELGKSPMDRDITVRLRGGTLIIRVAESGITMTGDAILDFEGIVEV